MPLFAETSPDWAHFDFPPRVFWSAIGLIVGLLLLFVIVLTMVMRHLQKSREFVHAERMKALEVGQSPAFFQPDKSRGKYAHHAFWIAFWIGAGVPVAAAWAAASVTMQDNLHSLGLVLAVWINAAVISVASVVCATVLMTMARRVDSDREKAAPQETAGSGA